MTVGRPCRLITLRIQARRRAGLSRAEVARAAGVSPATVKRFEEGAEPLAAGRILDVSARRATADIFDGLA